MNTLGSSDRNPLRAREEAAVAASALALLQEALAETMAAARADLVQARSLMDHGVDQATRAFTEAAVSPGDTQALSEATQALQFHDMTSQLMARVLRRLDATLVLATASLAPAQEAALNARAVEVEVQSYLAAQPPEQFHRMDHLSLDAGDITFF